jgi:hypothetical protein
MKPQVWNTSENKNASASNSASYKEVNNVTPSHFTDNRQEAVNQRKLQKVITSGNSEIVQPQYFKTEKAKNKKGMQGSVEVVTGSTSVSFAGRLIGPEGAAVKAAGKVYMPEYNVSPNRAIAAKRIRETKGTVFGNYFDPSNALRVQNLTADPKGLKLGHLLTYHHGLEAQKRGKPFVIAQKVSDARGPFYTPLGFTDYNTSKPWQDLDNEEKALDIVIRSGYVADSDLKPVLARLDEVRNEKVASDMIIKTSSLIANSKSFYERSWKAE